MDVSKTSLFDQVWYSLTELHWLFNGVSNAFILIILGRLLIYTYREHSYLYQFEDRSKAFDTWIEFLIPLAKTIRWQSYRNKVHLNLSRAGTRFDWNEDHFIASQFLAGLAMALTGYIFIYLILGMGMLTVVVLTILAIGLPYLKLSDLAKSRFKAANKDLPYFIDYLGLAMGAGLDFNQALATVVGDAPDSPLSTEFSLVLRNMRLGMSKSEALLEMDRRLNSPSIKLFVQTLIQGMELGTDIVQTLTVMSETLQEKRFQMAEEMAGKISVRMMLPMMCFVMPSVMIVLLGPMVLSYFQAG